MEVAAAAAQQPPFRRQAVRQGLPLPVVGGVPGLQAVQPRLLQHLAGNQKAALPVLSPNAVQVGQVGQAPRLVDDRPAGLGAGGVLLHPAGAAGEKIPLHGLHRGGGPPLPGQRLRNMDAGQEAPASRLHLLRGHRHPGLGQPLQHPLVAPHPLLPLPGQEVQQRRRVRADEQTHDMHLAARLAGGKLHPRDHPDAQLLPGGQALRQPRHSVVVGDSHRPKAQLPRQRHQLPRAKGPVRSGGVGVEVGPIRPFFCHPFPLPLVYRLRYHKSASSTRRPESA